MKTSISKSIFTFFAMILMVICLTISVSAANADIFDSLSFTAAAGDSNTTIRTQTGISGARYLLLPSSADMTQLVLDFDGDEAEIKTAEGTFTVNSGVAFDLTEICTPSDGEYTITISGKKLIIMKSANVRSLYYVSDDPANAGRPFVDAAKGNEAEGKMSIVGADGEVDYSDTVTEIKGRGNSTFHEYSKKPYQIKLKNKTALIEGSSDKSKKWVLLANAADYSLLHNSATFALAQELGMAYTNDYEAVDFYFDGEYRGHYLITEKVEVASNNVDIDDLDEMIEEANSDNDAYENPVVVHRTTASKGEASAAVDSKGSYKYVQGLNEPELPEGCTHHAYLLELEFAKRYPDEQSGFVTNLSQRIVTKNPEYLTKETGAFIAAFWQEFEDACYSANGYNKKTGKYYYEYCDLESLVNLYLINELGKNYDAFASSAFFYLPADSDIMYAGPVWDYDLCYGIGQRNREVAAVPEYFFASQRYLLKGLMNIQSFRDAVKATLDPETGDFYLATQTLLGPEGEICSQAEMLEASQKMNYTIWDIYADDYYFYNYEDDGKRIVVKEGKEENYENAVEFFEYFTKTRLNWLSKETSKWNGNKYTITLDPVPELNFFEKIAAWFRSIIDWFINLFK
ncbi:MAG: CotH kinase family protein [Clostridia bacterium]|nr:CotH kinase family protein [Clostridia bacterium]